MPQVLTSHLPYKRYARTNTTIAIPTSVKPFMSKNSFFPFWCKIERNIALSKFSVKLLYPAQHLNHVYIFIWDLRDLKEAVADVELCEFWNVPAFDHDISSASSAVFFLLYH